MIEFPKIDPVAISLGPIEVHWYGLMYLVGFLGFWWLGIIRARQVHTPVKPEQISDMLFYGVLAVILGGRIGYILFYNFLQFVDNPLILFKIWEGGMSFHGGLIGVFVAGWLYQRKMRMGFLPLMDFVAPMVPIGLGAGRVGRNFINGELWGRVSDVPWAMVFPGTGQFARHPSQLYQVCLEGVVLFAILWIFSRKPRPIGAVSGLFLIFYGIFRFAVEFVREPDAHLGYIAFGWMTMGQLLTIPMILAGVILFLYAYRSGRYATAVA